LEKRGIEQEWNGVSTFREMWGGPVGRPRPSKGGEPQRKVGVNIGFNTRLQTNNSAKRKEDKNG